MTPLNIYEIAHKLYAHHGVETTVPPSVLDDTKDTVRLRIPLLPPSVAPDDVAKATILRSDNSIALPDDLSRVQSPVPGIGQTIVPYGRTLLKTAVTPGDAASSVSGRTFPPDEVRRRAALIRQNIGKYDPRSHQFGKISDLLNAHGIDHRVLNPHAEGAWGGNVDPNIAVEVSKNDKAHALALLSHGLLQDAVGSEEHAPLGSPANALRIRIHSRVPLSDAVRDNIAKGIHYPPSMLENYQNGGTEAVPGGQHMDTMIFNLLNEKGVNLKNEDLAQTIRSIQDGMKRNGMHVASDTLTLHPVNTGYHVRVNRSNETGRTTDFAMPEPASHGFSTHGRALQGVVRDAYPEVKAI